MPPLAPDPAPRVLAVSSSAVHAFSKEGAAEIRLLEGVGVEGDAHAGVTVQHRSRLARDPDSPNLRQVHLLQAELLDEVAGKGFDVRPGQMGENITTRGLDLLGLPEGTELAIGASARVRITGLRNPCRYIDDFRPGLLAAVLDRTPGGELIRKAGVMGVVLAGGAVRPGDTIVVHLPPAPRRKLEPV